MVNEAALDLVAVVIACVGSVCFVVVVRIYGTLDYKIALCVVEFEIPIPCL